MTQGVMSHGKLSSMHHIVPASLRRKSLRYTPSTFGESKDIAIEKICAFYDIDDLEEMDLNLEKTQRIFFVAANFRREIASSVLWLRNYGIDARCYKVSPFVYNGKLLVDFDQIIPMKDAEDYVIKMAEKKKAETTQAVATRLRHNERSEFWQKFIAYNQQVNGDYASSAGTPDSWLGKGGIGIPGVSVNIVISKTFSRTEIYGGKRTVHIYKSSVFTNIR